MWKRGECISGKKIESGVPGKRQSKLAGAPDQSVCPTWPVGRKIGPSLSSCHLKAGRVKGVHTE